MRFRIVLPLLIIAAAFSGTVIFLAEQRIVQPAEESRRAPVAHVGLGKRTVTPKGTLILSGVGSYDPDGGPINSYRWEIVEAPAHRAAEVGAVLSDGPDPVVKERPITSADVGAWGFQLTVTDDEGARATAVAKVVVRERMETLNDPRHVTADAARLADDEVIAGLTINGQSVAFPQTVMDRYGIANDVVGGEPVVIVLCEFCESGVAYTREVDGEILTFSGLGGTVVEDNYTAKDLETGSTWFVVGGSGSAGVHRDTQLPSHDVYMTSWSEWRTEHPETLVLVE